MGEFEVPGGGGAVFFFIENPRRGGGGFSGGEGAEGPRGCLRRIWGSFGRGTYIFYFGAETSTK